MNPKDPTYAKYALAREMYETVDVVKRFDPTCGKQFADLAKKMKGIFFTGEGSSRIFPAKRAIYRSKQEIAIPMATDGSTQALEYNLSGEAVFGASNSGKTRELVRLFKKLKSINHPAFFGITTNADTPIESLARKTHLLSCGREDAVAATKSVIEEALFYDSVQHALAGRKMPDMNAAAEALRSALTADVDRAMVTALTKADVVYFAGRNNGVAEELRLKTNEITRKKSDYLEGTYAVHGIEEVMDKNEAVIIIDPFPDEEEKFAQCLSKGVGMNVFAIASRQTSFPTLMIPEGGHYAEYVQLAAGWNLLLETGIALGIDLDTPLRARKIGNEYSGTQ